MNVWLRVSRGLGRGAGFVGVVLIRVYQRVISPWTASSCRYYPSCSQYAVDALTEHGVLRGSWLAVRRLGRCHPWTAGGVDHVPPRSVSPTSVSPTSVSPTSAPLAGV